MTTKSKIIKVKIVDGPGDMQLMISLMRTNKGHYGIDIGKATSVQFTTDGKEPMLPNNFIACINGMIRDDESGSSWTLKGCLSDYPVISKFEGYYDSKTRDGSFIITIG